MHAVPVHDGVRTDRYKLMYFPRTREWNLFDLEEDPMEMKSVHGDANYAAILSGMQKRYRDLRQFYDVNSALIPAGSAASRHQARGFRRFRAESRRGFGAWLGYQVSAQARP